MSSAPTSAGSSIAPTGAAPKGAAPTAGPRPSLAAQMELDTRLIGMIVALAVIWVGFHILSGGNFLTARNLWNLSVQTASVGVMSAGMVLVIVTRNIDLSVGSILGFVGMVMGVTQAEILPQYLGFEHPALWAVTLLVGIGIGGAIGLLQGYIIAYSGVPAFIVTLGGLLVWRGAAWWVTSGRTVAPMDLSFRRMGGGIEGAIGASASWVVGVIACLAVIWGILAARKQRQRFHFPLKPVWAEVVSGVVGCVCILGAVMIANSYMLPERVARRVAEAAGMIVPEGTSIDIPHGLAVPVLIAAGVGIVVAFLSRRTRFGRYVFAIGGNPEAALLAGVNTRRVTMMVFGLMGVLCAVAAAISTARLNAATNSQGTLDELYVIAAAVIGGTSLAGGAGTVAGAMLGALVMQSLQSGMVLLGVDSPLQNIVVGIVLVIAVWIDTIYRRRRV